MKVNILDIEMNNKRVEYPFYSFRLAYFAVHEIGIKEPLLFYTFEQVLTYLNKPNGIT